MRTVFYAWQSETPHAANRDFIASALEAAMRVLNADLELLSADERLALDRDVSGVPGMAPIADTILEKIRGATLCVCDLTIVTGKVGRPERGVPNANVLIELGYALATHGAEVIVCVMNTHFGSPSALPFDLRHRNVPVLYELPPHATPGEREQQLAQLTASLTHALRLALRSTEAALAERLLGEPIAAHLAPAHAAAPMTQHVFDDSPAFELAHTRGRDAEGRVNDSVYWHDGPTAFLRLVPLEPLGLSRTEIAERARGRPPLEAFGRGALTRRIANERGVVAIAFDGGSPKTVVDRVTQLFRTGELWGLNRALLREDPRTARGIVISWPALRTAFTETLASYMGFARGSLRLTSEVILVAGLAKVSDALLTSPGMAEEERPRCLEATVRMQVRLADLAGDPRHLLEPLWTSLWDACGMNMPLAS